MLRSFFVRAAACFLLAACGSPAAVASPAPAAWVETRTADAGGEALLPVVQQAVRYRLERLGLQVRSRDASRAGAAAGLAAARSESILEAARRAGADFALECRCSGSASQLSLRMDWFEVGAGLKTASVDRKGSVDLEMDAVILRALDELLAQVGGRIAERVAAARGAAGQEGAGTGSGAGQENEGPGAAQSAGPSGGEAEATGAAGAVPPDHPVTELPVGETLPQSGVTPGVTPGTPQPAEAGRYAGAHLLVAASLAPFLAVGAAGYYFPIGYQSLLVVDALPVGAKGRLSLGGLIGVTAFQAQGATQTSLSFLAPIALSLRYGLELGRRWGLLFQLGAGPAFLLMSTQSQGTLVKVLPYVRSGVGGELALGRTASLGLEAAYEVYFETPYLIMGFAPGLGLSWRL